MTFITAHQTIGGDVTLPSSTLLVKAANPKPKYDEATPDNRLRVRVGLEIVSHNNSSAKPKSNGLLGDAIIEKVVFVRAGQASGFGLG